MVPKSVLCVVGIGKKTERILSQAFHDGARRHGIRSDVAKWDEVELDRYDAVAIPGARRDTSVHVYRECLRLGKTFYYMDNGYFASRWSTRAEDAMYRITVNAMQHDGQSGRVDESRFNRLGIEVMPWKKSPADNSVLVAMQSDWWYELNGLSASEFMRNALSVIREKCYGRIVIVREKPMTRHLLAAADPIDWRSTFAVVTHSSSAAFEAIIRGIPGFCLGKCAAWAVVNPETYDLASAPEVTYERRLRWAQVLASNQWNLSEIRSGQAWESLTAR